MPEPLTPGPPPLPAQPLELGAGAKHRRAEKWAPLVAALVLLAGAVVGAGGFLLEQATSNWRPHAVRTQTGWRITETRMLHFGGLALCNERLAWQDGSSILLFDLRSGDAKLLGPGNDARATWQPAVSERYVVWFEATRTSTSSAEAWTYDAATRRRRRIATLGDVLSFPSVSGTGAVWGTARDTVSRIAGVDLTSDRSFVSPPSTASR